MADFALSYMAPICFGCRMIFPESFRGDIFSQDDALPQGDALARNATLSRGKATALGCKATLSRPRRRIWARFVLNPVTGVNTPAAEAERLGRKAGMGLPSAAAGTTMAP